ncbi:hypothetical protein [Halpernia sp.]|uniref:hypothetical protein n=1 Tax=Halpernia sp. TaxID=2782209 RepID=UPI003A8C9F02
MKKIYQYLSVVTLLIILTTYSCNRSENETVLNKITPTSESLSENSDFQNLVLLIENQANKTTNLTELRILHKKNKLDEAEKLKFYHFLGFKNELSFIQYENDIIAINNKLALTYDFTKFTEPQKTDLIIGALNKSKMTSSKAGPCETIYSGCRRSALGVHIATTAACIAGGVGIAGLSFGIAAPLGGALAGACAAGSQIAYEGNIAVCNGNYQQCHN